MRVNVRSALLTGDAAEFGRGPRRPSTRTGVEFERLLRQFADGLRRRTIATGGC